MKQRPIEMTQIDKYTTKQKKKAKVCAFNKHTIADRLGAEEGLFFYRQIPLSETVAEKIGQELIDYAQDESTAFTLNRFCKKKGISSSTFRHWCKKFPCLKAAKEIALEWIADNREIGAITRILDSNAVFKKQAYYDSEYKEETVRIATLKKDESTHITAKDIIKEAIAYGVYDKIEPNVVLQKIQSDKNNTSD